MTTPPHPPPSPGPPKRQRAPTITIDTSAVSAASPPQDMSAAALPLQNWPNSPSSQQGDGVSPNNGEGSSSNTVIPSGASHRSQASRGSVPQLREAPSFDSRESRPTSPHNVSSPTSRAGDRSHNFLSVPGPFRSRQNSMDSDQESHSSSSLGGDTYAQTSSGSTQGDPSVRLDRSRNEDVMHDADALTPDPGTEADFHVEDNKFAFTPGMLNKLINPKSLSAFYALGGLAGLEKGLRTDRKAGLSRDESTLDGKVSFDSVKPAASKALGQVSTNDGETPRAQVTKTTTSGPGTLGGGLSRRKTSAPENLYADRKHVFSDNRLPVKKTKSLLQLMWITYNDKILILLSVAALVSLAVGLGQTLNKNIKHDETNPPVEWVEGVAIIVAILIVVIVGSLNDYQKERQFAKLNKKKDDREVNVVRSGKPQLVSVHDVLVGDVMILNPGDMVPVDGIYIEGHNIKCDESQSTGESDLIRKRPADDVYAAIERGEDLRKMDPFILSGSLVVEGVGRFLVTSTGVNSSHGKVMMSLRQELQITPLQSKLNTLAEYIAKLGGSAGLLLFVVLFIEFLARLKNNNHTSAEKGQEFLNIFIVTVTIIVVAVPEGLPLAVTLALAFATTRMLKDNNLVRHLQACEVMGNATAICSDKTGTLTQNRMMVVAGTLGTSSRFGGTTEPRGDAPPTRDGAIMPPKVTDDIPPQEVVSTLHSEVTDLLKESIVLNSTAFEGEVNGEQTYVGSKTETALLIFARDFLGLGPVGEERSNATLVQLIPFDSKRKCMGVVVSHKGKYRLLVKGASEILLEHCNQIITDPTKAVSSTPMSQENRNTLNSLITSYAERSLRTIGLVYRDYSSWPPRHARRADGDSNEAVFEDVFKDMTLLGIVGIQDPLREGVREAVETCQKAGVVVRMVTGDNMITAKAIASDCGIYTAGGIVMEGPTFRRMGKKEMQQIIPSLQVLARSSPEDKRILVKRLKELGETVAVTGDGTNDAPALRTADVGFSMGIAGTEVAKEASAIILMDDNFNSIVKAMMWGRAVNDAVKKFLQFQVTVNITAVLLTFITAVSSDTEESILTAVQLLWVNLIMDTMAALALATDPPTPSILNRKPDPKSAPLITITMWKMIIGESIYQLIVTLLLFYGAGPIFSYNDQDEVPLVPTLVFNTFVWMQIFNQWNNRRLDNHFNIFEGVLKNWFFMAINVVMVGGQVLIVFVGGHAFNVVKLDARGWGLAIAFGALSIPVGAAIRLIPDELLWRLIPDYLKNRKPKSPELTVEDEEQFRFPQALTDVREELSFIKRVKGGRLNNLVWAVQHPRETFIPRSRSGSRSRSNSIPVTPVDQPDDPFSQQQIHTPESRKRGRSNRSRSNSALGATTVMAGIIAGSVAGWSPIDRGHGDNDSFSFSRSKGRGELESREGVEVHPATRADDPVIVEEPQSYLEPPSQVPEITPAAAFEHGPGSSGQPSDATKSPEQPSEEPSDPKASPPTKPSPTP